MYIYIYTYIFIYRAERQSQYLAELRSHSLGFLGGDPRSEGALAQVRSQVGRWRNMGREGLKQDIGVREEDRRRLRSELVATVVPLEPPVISEPYTEAEMRLFDTPYCTEGDHEDIHLSGDVDNP